MTRLHRRRLHTILLAVNAVLAGIVVLQLRSEAGDSDAEAAPATPAVEGAAPPVAAAVPLPDLIGQADLIPEILARPVFSPTRRPDTMSGITEASPALPRLVGVVLSAARRFALLQMAGEPELRHVAEGQRIGAYRIEAIHADRIRLHGSGGSHELFLLPADPARSPPAAAIPAQSDPLLETSDNVD